MVAALGLLVGAEARGQGPFQGLDPGQVKDLFHRPEGIELVPLSWIKAMRSIRTNDAFLKFPERFGLIPDPTDPDGLPVGITASPSRGVEFLGKMVGVNCSACHVGALTFRGKPLPPILGAPGLFDLNGFYNELFASLGVMLKDPPSRQEFLEELARQKDVDGAIQAQQLLTALAAAGQLGGGELKVTAELFEARVLTAVVKVVEEAEAKLGGKPPDEAAIQKLESAVSDQIGQIFERDALGLVALAMMTETPGGPVKAARRSKPDPILDRVLGGLEVELSLLRERLRFIGALSKLHDAQRPLPGPGRIDAFDGIRDLVFPESDAIAANSPVSYPALWMINQTYWFHWDGNTNSVIERNIGQALGQGAPFQPVGRGHYHSKVQPRDVHELEWLVRKVTPPDWPAAAFGPVDQAKAGRGKAIYADRCLRCHAVVERGGHDILDVLSKAQDWARHPEGDPPAIPKDLHEKLIPIESVKTDPARAMNFATSVGRRPPLYTGGTDFAVALAGAAWGYTHQAYCDNDIPRAEQLKYDWPHAMVRWQTTRSYAARPLVSIWATAPYLHNGSVPTVFDLLHPARERPRTFVVGQREYDPSRLGFVTDPKKIPPEQIPLLFEINATAGGNLNIGHEGPEYGTDLTDDQRYDLIEYLKTL